MREATRLTPRKPEPKEEKPKEEAKDKEEPKKDAKDRWISLTPTTRTSAKDRDQPTRQKSADDKMRPTKNRLRSRTPTRKTTRKKTMSDDAGRHMKRRSSPANRVATARIRGPISAR